MEKIQEKFKAWLELREQGVSFNGRLLSNHEFHNPNITGKMLEFMGINEHGTNLPNSLYDPSSLPVDGDYVAIAEMQKAQYARSVGHHPPIHKGHQTGNDGSSRAKQHRIMLERFYSRDRTR